MKRPLILQNEEIIERVNLKLDEIVNYFISLEVGGNLPIGLFTGSAGISLFLFYYSRYKKDRCAEYKAMQFLLNSVDRIDENFHHPFCGGISGVCWCIQHLIDKGFVDNENLEIVEAFDRYLCNQVGFHSAAGNYDFLHGAIGSALYLLKRIDDPLVMQTTENIINSLDHSKLEHNGSRANAS